MRELGGNNDLMLMVAAQTAQKGWDSGVPLVPLWLGVGLAVIAMVATAAHMNSLRDADVPESRRRIRMLNGWVLVVLAPVSAWAFCMVRPVDQAEFVFAFVIVIFLLLVAVAMACLDALNSLRLQRQTRKELREEVARLRSEIERRRIADSNGDEKAAKQ